MIDARSATSNVPNSIVPNSIVLVGFMGSGKSSVSRRLARRLKLEAIDLDGYIEQLCGQSIAAIFAARGEAEFRDLETAALAECLQKPGVLATGGGILKRQENRDLLRAATEQGSTVIYLRAGPDALARRIRRQPGKRPLIDGNAELNQEETRRRVEQLLAERAAHYESCSTLIVDTDDRDLGEVVQQIITSLKYGD